MRHALIVIHLLAMPISAASEGPPELAGRWEGTLQVLEDQSTLKLVLRVTGKAPDYEAKLDSPEQGALGLWIDTLSVTPIPSAPGTAQVRWTLKKLGASFEGVLSSSPKALTGKFTQAGSAMPLAFAYAGADASVRRPQDPQKPYPYEEITLAYKNPATGGTLAGTLTLPKGKGPFPAVVLITGSGPQDRDATIMGHRPFLVIADHLTRLGVAVLRVDDRSVGGSSGNLDTATTADFATDVEAGLALLRTRAEVDPKRVGLLGHSEGALVAGLVASRTPDVAFVVLLGGPAVPGKQIVLAQTALISRAQGVPEAVVAEQRRDQETLFGIIETMKEPASRDQALDAAIRAAYERQIKAIPGAPPIADAAVRQQIRGLVTPWFRYFLSYDPRPALTKVSCPTLALIGEKDLQVPADENLAETRTAMAKNTNLTSRKLPGLNHLFQTAKTGSPKEYAGLDETFAPTALAMIGDWILMHMKR